MLQIRLWLPSDLRFPGAVQIQGTESVCSTEMEGFTPVLPADRLLALSWVMAQPIIVRVSATRKVGLV
jgi:hypothetical protein